MFERKRLERQLHDERPAPDVEFLRKMEGRISEERRSGRPAMRLVVAAAVAVGAVTAAGATGGLGYAADAITHTSDSVVSAITASTTPKTSSSSTSSSPQFSSNVVAASSQYGGAGWYCFVHGHTHYDKIDVTSASTWPNSGWNIVWGPDQNGENRSCP